LARPWGILPARQAYASVTCHSFPPPRPNARANQGDGCDVSWGEARAETVSCHSVRGSGCATVRERPVRPSRFPGATPWVDLPCPKKFLDPSRYKAAGYDEPFVRALSPVRRASHCDGLAAERGVASIEYLPMRCLLRLDGAARSWPTGRHPPGRTGATPRAHRRAPIDRARGLTVRNRRHHARSARRPNGMSPVAVRDPPRPAWPPAARFVNPVAVGSTLTRSLFHDRVGVSHPAAIDPAGPKNDGRALKVDPGWREWRVAETRRRPHERRSPHP
jgi:hypothetical protein